MTQTKTELLKAKELAVALYEFKQTQPATHVEWHDLQRSLESMYEFDIDEVL